MPACKLDILRQHVREPAITVAVPAKGLVFQRVFEQAVQKRRARCVVTVALQRRRVFQQLRQNERNNFLRPLPELFIRRAVLNRIILIECVRFFNRLPKASSSSSVVCSGAIACAVPAASRFITGALCKDAVSPCPKSASSCLNVDCKGAARKRGAARFSCAAP